MKTILLVLTFDLALSLSHAQTINPTQVDKVDAFVNQWKGNPVDVDGAYGFQCVDLIRRYAIDVLNLNQHIPQGNAYKIFQITTSQVFSKFVYQTDSYPKKGDIIFWHEAPANGHSGHVAIVVQANAKSLTTFDQNYCADSGSGIGPCAPRLITRDYKDVAGWLGVPVSSN